MAKNTATAPSSVQIDLRKFTFGFTLSPVFKVFAASGGTTSQSGDGGWLVTFTPVPDYTGRAKFDFIVTDRDGISWKQTCAVLVAAK